MTGRFTVSSLLNQPHIDASDAAPNSKPPSNGHGNGDDCLDSVQTPSVAEKRRPPSLNILPPPLLPPPPPHSTHHLSHNPPFSHPQQFFALPASDSHNHNHKLHLHHQQFWARHAQPPPHVPHHARLYAPGDFRFWPYPPPQPPTPYHVLPQTPQTPQTPWRRERRSKACLRCHTKKIKCEGEGAVCDGCRQAACECRWVEMKKRGPKPKPKIKAKPKSKLVVLKPSNDPQPDPPAVSPSPPLPHVPMDTNDSMANVLSQFRSNDVVDSDTREAVEYFFDYFYGRMPLFHPASFVRRVVAGAVEPLLLDTMKACTARIVSQHTGRHIDVDALGCSVRRRLLAGLDRPTDDYIRAVVVAAALAGGESKFMSYNSLSCLASSLVTRLGWHTLDLAPATPTTPDVSWDRWVQLEERRRTFWAVYQLDCFHSLTADRPTTIDAARLFIAAPGADSAWDDVSVLRLTHWPTRHAHVIDTAAVASSGALSYTFVALCNLASIMARVSAFTWNVRVALAPLPADRASDIRFLPPPPEALPPPRRSPAQTLFDYPEFARLHDALRDWLRALVPPESMCDSAAPPIDFALFGSPASRRYAMRVRYFNLRCYATPVLLLLHLANRPSFFVVEPTSSPAPPPVSAHPSPSPSPARSDAPEDAAIRAMLGSSFSSFLNDGLLAHDVVPHSWDICLREIDELVAHLDRNSDIPMDRCDASISFCLFIPITVLVRQIRSCRERIALPAIADSDASDLRAEISRRVAALRRLWTMLKDLGFIWGVARMEALLRSMQVDEIANAADLFSGLSL
ncbi:hypothetical protein EV174_005260 [Coemansia sp. RSA 2320]|nr:hypothetical protein EV174_005260 [Coemansia sp. RSA 2320]